MYETRRHVPYISLAQLLGDFFRGFDATHDSALFALDMTDRTSFGDDVLMPLIEKLYKARYCSMPADIIGNTYQHDRLGRRTQLANPLSQTWTTAYSCAAGGLRTVLTDAAGRDTQRDTDRLGRPAALAYLSESPKLTPDVAFAYDLTGNRVRMTETGGAQQRAAQPVRVRRGGAAGEPAARAARQYPGALRVHGGRAGQPHPGGRDDLAAG